MSGPKCLNTSQETFSGLANGWQTTPKYVIDTQKIYESRDTPFKFC